MKNILEILKELGIEIPTDKTESLNRLTLENYRTLDDYNNQKTKSESKITGLQDQLKTATDGLKAFDGIDKKAIDEQIATLTKKLAEETQTHQAKLADIESENVLTAHLAGYKFPNDYTKRGVMADIKTKKLPIVDGKMLGFDDLIKEIQKTQPTAVMSATENTPEKVGLPPGNMNANTLSGIPDKAKFKMMGYKERLEIQKTSPELYKQLKE